MPIRSIAASLILLTQIVQTTTWDQLSVKELYDSSEVVVYVSIESGERLYNGEFSCGAKFKAKVLDHIKGASLASVEFFGEAWYDGMPIGGQYLLFLRPDNASLFGVVTTNAMAISADEEFHKKCDNLRSGYTPIPAYGRIQAKYTSLVNDFALIVPRKFIRFPKSVTTYRDDELPNADIYDTRWVDLAESLRYLKSLKASATEGAAAQPDKP